MIFYPDAHCDSVYNIPFKKLYDMGYRGVIFDIDNTIVKHGYPADIRAVALFNTLRHMGFKTCIISNNKQKRVVSFAKDVKSMAVWKANKPLKRGYLLACRLMKTNKDNTLFVGDQLFTDVWGAKICNVKSILVDPIDTKEEIQIVLKRYLEKPILFFYNRHGRNFWEERTGID